MMAFRQELLDLYINLLTPYRAKIKRMAIAADAGDLKQLKKLDKLFKNTGADNWETLDRYLREAEEKKEILAKPDKKEKPAFASLGFLGQ